MGIERGYTTLPKSRDHLLQYLPQSQDELPIRKMSDSFDSAIIPLRSNLELQERYITFLGHIRLGRLMEDMDIFAGNNDLIIVKIRRIILSFCKIEEQQN